MWIVESESAKNSQTAWNSICEIVLLLTILNGMSACNPHVSLK